MVEVTVKREFCALAYHLDRRLDRGHVIADIADKKPKRGSRRVWQDSKPPLAKDEIQELGS